MNTRLGRFLERLEGVQQTGPNAWVARCPAHRDRTPSLTIAEGERQPVVLKCFAGCSLEAVLAAVDLRPGDLMVDRPLSHRIPGRRRAVSPMEMLKAMAHEALVIAIAVSTDDLTPKDKERLVEAARRIQEALDYVG